MQIITQHQMTQNKINETLNISTNVKKQQQQQQQRLEDNCYGALRVCAFENSDY
jgi:hypothetical protein